MLELMPEEIQQQLQERFGDDYSALPRLERLILATAAMNKWFALTYCRNIN